MSLMCMRRETEIDVQESNTTGEIGEETIVFSVSIASIYHCDYSRSTPSSKMMDALTAANMPLYGVEVTSDYMPVQVENPTTNLKGVGPLYGKVEAGAVAQTSIGGTGLMGYRGLFRRKMAILFSCFSKL
ncbi:hypothetical protein NECAME_12562 [Necator americanus]|uniref:Uncharacterized protein n=1 Tax=Necator americanus TaxID=51031 RepID=W2T185_NECAM|nr:hypothetical protein NECAME_12562 [Necator americanus]ETN75011.1 hypothetical protein NECAME_12562 [Necator americanus]